MRYFCFFLFLCFPVLLYSQNELLDSSYLIDFKVKAVRIWSFKYENGEKKDSSLYEYEYDSTGTVVAEKFGFSSDLKHYTQWKNGEIADQDGNRFIWYNPQSALDKSFNLKLLNEYGVKKSENIYNPLGNIQTIKIRHEENQWDKLNWRKKEKRRSKIEFYYGYFEKDSCGNMYFNPLDLYRMKRGSKEAKQFKDPEYKCPFMKCEQIVHRVEWENEEKITFETRYEYVFF